MKRIAEELVWRLRNLVVTKLVPQADLDLPEAELCEVRAQAESVPAPQLTRLFDLAQRAVAEVKTSEQPRYALEVGLLKACYLAPGADVEELIARLEDLGGRSSPGRGPGARPLSGGTPGCAAGTDAPARRTTRKETAAPLPAPASQPQARAPSSTAPADEPSRPRAPAAAPAGPPSTADRWRALVAEVERASSGAALLVNALKQAAVVALTESEVALRLPPGLPFSTVEKRQQELLEIFARFFGRPVKLSLARGAPGEVGVETAGPAEQARSLAELEQAEREARSERVRGAARQHPNIQEAAKILEGEVTKIEEL
jgi:DNA polymerase-3 subunit gamma/tau